MLSENQFAMNSIDMTIDNVESRALCRVVERETLCSIGWKRARAAYAPEHAKKLDTIGIHKSWVCKVSHGGWGRRKTEAPVNVCFFS